MSRRYRQRGWVGWTAVLSSGPCAGAAVEPLNASAPHPPFHAYGRPARRLRVAVLAPALASHWLADALDHLSTCDGIGLDLLLLPASPASREAKLAFDLRAYLMLERLRRRGRRGPLSRVDLAAHAQAARIDVIDVADEAALRARLTERRCDLILAAAGFELAEALAADTPWGCWWLGDDLLQPRQAGLAFLGPMLAGDRVTRMQLRLQSVGGSSVLLADSSGATQGGSFELQRDKAFRKLPALLARALRDIAGDRSAAPRRQVARLQFVPATAPLGHAVGLRAAWRSARNTWRWWRHQWSGQEMWFVAVRRAAQPVDPLAPKIDAVRALVAPGGRYWADPFIHEDAGRRLLFVEEYDLRDGRGVIACIELDREGRARRLGLVLDEPYHLSYPQVFHHEGQRYLTVESGAARRVRLFREADFPLRWEPVADLLNGGVGADPTLFEHDGRWYLFTTCSEHGAGTCEELFLFSAETLQGPYVPHPCNPVVNDVRRARPAGPLFVRGGRLLRPAQDCAPIYGAAVVFNEVTELTPMTYRETPLARFDASWAPGSSGCHTYASVAGVEVLDARGHPPAAMPRMAVDELAEVADGSGAVPWVSVIMPVYNGLRFLAEALDSVLAQTLENIEVIVVNDGSSDGSGALADRYAAADPQRVRVLHQHNQGLPLARNAAIAAARGRYLALLDADDVWYPGHLAACVRVLENDPGVGLVHANAEDIDAQGQLLSAASFHTRWPARAARDPFRAMLLRRQHVACLTAVFRSSVIERVGGFDARFNRLGSEDRDMWLRIAEVSRLVYLDELHARYRVHGANMSANAERMWHAQRTLVDKHAQSPHGRRLRRRALAAVDAEWGHQLAVAAPLWPPLRAFLSALLRDPLRIDAWKGLLRRILIGRRSPVLVPPPP